MKKCRCNKVFETFFGVFRKTNLEFSIARESRPEDHATMPPFFLFINNKGMVIASKFPTFYVASTRRLADSYHNRNQSTYLY